MPKKSTKKKVAKKPQAAKVEATMTVAEKKRIEALAEHYGYSVATFIKRACLGLLHVDKNALDN